MKTIVKVYNNCRVALSFLGPAFILLGIYSIINPEGVSTFSGGIELQGAKKFHSSITIVGVGIIMIVVRFKFMKYSKLGNSKNDVPLPTDVKIEKTNDVNENIKRYKKAQADAVKDK